MSRGKNFLKLALALFFLILGFSFFSFDILAQNTTDQICKSIEEIEKNCKTLTVPACQALLEKCRDFYEAQAESFRQQVQEKESQARTFENQIAIFTSKIQQLTTLIQRNSLVMKNLNFQIQDTEKSIDETSVKIEETRFQLRETLQSMYEQSRKSGIEILLAGDTFASFFENLTALEILQAKNKEILDTIQNLHTYLTNQKEKLENEKESLERTLLLNRLQKEELEQLKKAREILLQKTKGEQKKYELYLKEVEAKAAEIRKRIFELAQIPETQAPTLQEAYVLAKSVENITGVRPAFLLGLLTVESAIGKNVGQCNCKGNPTCRYPEISWQEVMNQSQWPYFLEITSKLGLNPNTTPVSCAINGGQTQFGGAMGPAQFLPSTWIKYEERLNSLIPKSEQPANPWRIRDAFLAAGLYLADWGASSQLYNDEIGAATAYLCGTNRLTPRCKRAGGEWYRYEVMKKASEYQNFIEEGILK